MSRVLMILIVVFTVCISAAQSNFSSTKEVPFSEHNKELISPHDRIKENQILVYSDKIILDIKDALWARYTDTNSMDPVLDEGANGIEIQPKDEHEIHIGDIIAYESKLTDGLIVHRIIDIKKDEQGTYFVLRGDNNPEPDPENVRFSQVKSVLIGVIY